MFGLTQKEKEPLHPKVKPGSEVAMTSLLRTEVLGDRIEVLESKLDLMEGWFNDVEKDLADLRKDMVCVGSFLEDLKGIFEGLRFIVGRRTSDGSE